MRVRDNVAFETSDGTTLRGWHYSPGGSPARGAIVMAHGITAVKEMWLDRFADVFCEAGFHVLVYDHRNLGESAGQPRQEIDPWARSGITATPLPSPRHFPASTRRALASGARATPAVTYDVSGG